MFPIRVGQVLLVAPDSLCWLLRLALPSSVTLWLSACLTKVSPHHHKPSWVARGAIARGVVRPIVSPRPPASRGGGAIFRGVQVAIVPPGRLPASRGVLRTALELALVGQPQRVVVRGLDWGWGVQQPGAFRLFLAGLGLSWASIAINRFVLAPHGGSHAER